MFILVVGGGKVGSYLTRALLNAGHEVLVIEKNGRKARLLAQLIDRECVIVGDGCDPVVLESAGLARADVVVADTGDDEDNLVVALLTKRKSKARCIARVNNPRNRQIFESLDPANPVTVISATEIILDLLQEYVNAATGKPCVEALHVFGKGNLRLVRVPVRADSPLVGKLLVDVHLPEDATIVAVEHPDGEVEAPGIKTALGEGDEIIAIAKSGAVEQISEYA